MLLEVIRHTILDGLDGGGPDAWLFCPLAQRTLQRALGLDEVGTLNSTHRTVNRLTQIARTERAPRLRWLIAHKAYKLVKAELERWGIQT